jgi:streptomycin 6-kinase
MSECYTHSVPDELIVHVTTICGSKGEKWLAGLPSQIDELSRQWSIEVGEPFAAGEFNFVAPAIRAYGEGVVLKIAPPYDDGECLREAEFLRIRKGRGVVRLLDEDSEKRAILMERAIPGRNLAEIFAGRECESLAPAIDVLHLIVDRRPQDLVYVKTLDQWFDGLRRFEGTEFPVSYATKALDSYDRLIADGRADYYLHGDFHPANVVNATRETYLAIDPKGVIGHIGYDIAVFLNNFHWWQETKPDVRTRLDHAVHQFSEAFDIDPLELREWAFAQMVLGAWWTFDEMPQFYNNEVAKADIWDV